MKADHDDAIVSHEKKFEKEMKAKKEEIKELSS